jgi:hypothetical protein
MSEHDVAPFLREYLAREGLTFRDEEGWEELADHVKVHKYFMDRKSGKETDWRDALDSWFRTVYKPLRAACDSEEVHEAFPNKKTGELYMGISHHWLFMKQYQPETTPAEAAHDFAIRYGEGLRRWFRRVDDTGIS